MTFLLVKYLFLFLKHLDFPSYQPRIYMTVFGRYSSGFNTVQPFSMGEETRDVFKSKNKVTIMPGQKLESGGILLF